MTLRAKFYFDRGRSGEAQLREQVRYQVQLGNEDVVLADVKFGARCFHPVSERE